MKEFIRIDHAGIPMRKYADMPKEHFNAIAAHVTDIRQELTGVLRGQGIKVEVIDRKADYLDSIAVLQERGLRLLTSDEAFLYIANIAELRNTLKGKFFYLSGRGLTKSGNYLIDKASGKIKMLRRKPNQYDMERTVYLWPGDRPLSIDVTLDNDDTKSICRRFNLSAVDKPEEIAQAIVGTPEV